MASSGEVLEREIGLALKADATMQSIFGNPMRIYTNAPEDAVQPYIVYSGLRSEDNSDDTSRGTIHTVTLTVWENGESEAVLKMELDTIRRLLDRKEKTMNVAPHALVALDYELQDVRRENDGQALVGVAQFRAFMGDH